MLDTATLISYYTIVGQRCPEVAYRWRSEISGLIGYAYRWRDK